MMELVSVDIGGTHARFSIATIHEDGTITLDEPETIHTKDHASFQTAWEDYRDRKGGSQKHRKGDKGATLVAFCRCVRCGGAGFWPHLFGPFWRSNRFGRGGVETLNRERS